MRGEVRYHIARMDACIGAACGVEDDLFLRDRAGGIFNGLLDGRAMRLALPAHEGAAIKFHGEGEAGHVKMRLPIFR